MSHKIAIAQITKSIIALIRMRKQSTNPDDIIAYSGMIYELKHLRIRLRVMSTELSEEKDGICTT